MKINIIEGPHTKEAVKNCYDYIMEMQIREKPLKETKEEPEVQILKGQENEDWGGENMTIEEQIDEELRDGYTLLQSNGKRKMWVSKTETINYKNLYEAIAQLNINRNQRVIIIRSNRRLNKI